MGFLQPALLAALALVAIPLLLHLFARRKVQQVAFPALMLLLGSKRHSLRVLTLQQWLVLLCRLCAVGLLAFAFAQPVLHNTRLSLPGTRDRVALHIIIDNSPSMSRRRGGTDLLERAKSAGAKLASRAAYDDEMTVEPACGENGRGDALSPAAAAAAIKRIPAGSCLARLDLKINRAVREMRQSPASERRIVIFSDFQTNGFGLKPPAPVKGDPALIPVDLTSGAPSHNAWISGVTLPLFPLSGEEAPICFRVDSSGRGKTPFAVSLVADGGKRGEQTLDPGPNGAAQSCFSLTFGEPGRHWGKITVSGDLMPADNTRYFTFNVHKEIPLALISGEGDVRDATKGAFYSSRALRAIAGAGQSVSAVNMTLIPPGSLTPRAFPRSGVVFIPDGSDLSQSALSALGDFAANGGGVFLTAGSNQQTASITAQTLFGGSISISVPKPETQQAGDNAAAFLSVGGIDASHPLFRGLSGVSGAAFRETRFGRPARIRITGADVSAPASLSDGSPLLVERRLGRGKILLLASSLDPASTNLPLKPSFVPFVLLMVKYLGEAAGREIGEFTAGSGVRIQEDAPNAVRSLTARNIETGAEAELVRISEDGRGTFASRAGAEPAEGVYKVLLGNKTADLFAVNADPREGRLASLSPARFKSFYKDFSVYSVKSSGFTDSAKIASLTFTRRAAALWFPALLGALLFLLAETVISNKK